MDSNKITDCLLEKFLRYVQIWTSSDSEKADNGVMPSTKQQMDFAHILGKELIALDINDVQLTENGYVCARICASKGMENVPAVAFFAHMDTSEEVSGKDVKPKVIENYDGSIIQLDSIELNPETDSALAHAINETIICSDGTTLLGADDKAGIAIIMTAIEHILKNDIPHGTIEIMFSPDEETGHGMDKVPLEWFTAKYGYTIDGGTAGEIETECFNAWKSEITFTGKAMHTGTARPNMVNAISMASDFISFLPRHEAPETTDNYQGFYAPMEITGHIETASVILFLRDFDSEGMERRKTYVNQLAQTIQQKYSGSNVSVKHTQQYLNMKDRINEHPYVADNLVKAVRSAGIEPVFKPIRGGTDGSRLSEMGFPCPNIFTGGHNFHSKYEWASLQQMEYAVSTLLNLVKLQADK